MNNNYYYIYLKMDESDVIIRFNNDCQWVAEYVKGDIDLLEYIDDFFEQDIDDVINLLLFDFDTVEEIEASEIDYFI